MSIKIPNDVFDILKQLNDNGYEAYIVGGAVRDIFLQNKPHDWDITTNATPDEVKSIFKKTIDTGLKHGTVTAMINHEGYEITTYRIDGEYEDNRRPSNIEFTTDLSKDLERRDFTFNAMAMDKDGNIVDIYNGRTDLTNKIVKAVGNPEKRIQEDALRMLRAIRFSAKYGYEIDKDLYNAIKNNAHLIQNVSYERIENEVTKILTSGHPEKFLELYNLGLTKYIMPEFDVLMNTPQNTPWHIYNVGMHTMKAVEQIDNDKNLRWAMLLHDMGKPACKSTDDKGQDHFYDHPVKSTEIADKILKRFKFSTKDMEEIKKLVYYHDIHYKKMNKIRKFVAKEGIDFCNKLIKVQYADISSQSNYKYEEKVNNIEYLNNKIQEVYNDKTAITLKDLKISGNDLIEIGFKGKEIGEILNTFYNDALSNPNSNNEKSLKQRAKTIFNNTHKLDDIIKQNTKEQEQKIIDSDIIR